MTDKALGTAGHAPRTIRQARAALIDAEDEATAATAAVRALEARQADAKAAAGFASDRVTQAAVRLLRGAPEVAAAVAEAERLVRDLLRAGSALLWLERQGVLSRRPEAPEFNLLRRVGGALGGLYTTASVMVGPDLRSDPDLDGAAPWQACVAALMEDATAPLPAAI